MSRRAALSLPSDSFSQCPNDPLREMFEACRVGEVSKVKKLVTNQTVNARDSAGRKSSPLHIAAGLSSWPVNCIYVMFFTNLSSC